MKTQKKLLLSMALLPALTFAAGNTESDISLSHSQNVFAVSQQVNKVTIKGVVKDNQGLEVIGANIFEKGTTNGTITDFEGKFTLDVAPGAVIEISYIGFNKQTIKVGNKKEFSIILAEDSKALDEVVVVGYGVQKKKLVTGATVQVKGDDLQKLNTVNALGALQSQSPGVNITQNSGMPGEGFKVNIRGLGTVGNSSPLYVIDGVSGGDINTLNPADIESIDVLKDAASAAIYGARAANGVILITTKHGKTGKLQVSYDGYVGIQNLPKTPELTNAKQYMELMDRQDGAYDWATLLPKDIYNSIQDGSWEGTNWLDESLNKNALVHNHAFNVAGGSELSKFSLGVSYTKQEGTIGEPVAPDYSRYTVRLNSDHVLLKNDKRDIIRFGENLMYTYSENSGISINGVFTNDVHSLLNGVPVHPLYNKDGEYYDQTDKEENGWGYNQEAYNVIAHMVAATGQNLNKKHKLHGSMFLEIEPIKNLKYKSTFGYKMQSNSYRKYEDVYNLAPRKASSEDLVQQTMGSQTGWTWENTISYSHKWKNQHIDAVIGQSIEKNAIGEQLSVRNRLSLFPGSFDHAYIDNTQALETGKTTISGYPYQVGKLASFFGRVNYNFKEKYMISATLRADGSSNFAPGNRWGVFPSASAGWVMTNEEFMQETSSWLDFFKWRLSWGQNGNAAISPFQYLSTIAFDSRNSYVFGTEKGDKSQGGYPNILPNEDISWETSEQWDAGFDARFFNSRLGVAFDYYYKATKDWLVRAPILLTTGTGAPDINGGDVVNQGVEVALTWNDQVGGFRYGANVNFSYNHNEVTRLANAEGIIRGPSGLLMNIMPDIYRAEVGYPIGYFYGYETLGVFQNQQQVDDTKAKLPSAKPGELIFKDNNNEGAITDDDRTMIGDPNPKFRLGVGVNMSYKGFDLTLAGTGAFGQDIAKLYRHGDTYIQNFTIDDFNAWNGEGTSNTIPALAAKTSRREFSDIYVEKGDYFRIQNLTIGYDFKKAFSKMPLQQCRVYIAAQNLCTITGYSGMDPEVGYGGAPWGSGVDIGFYPSPRTFMFGVNLKY